MRRFFARLPAFLKTKWTIGILIVLAAGGGIYAVSHSGKSTYQFVTVTRGSIVETVSVTGNTTPEKSVSLGFGTAGTVQHVYAEVGDRISAGAVLASLNTSDLSAQLLEAQATVDGAEAKLAGLQAGSRPEDIASAQAAYDKSVQDLANLYSAVSDTAADSFQKANDAVRNQLSPLFSNADGIAPQLTFSTARSQAATDAENARVAAGAALNALQNSLPTLESDPQSALDADIMHALSNLSVVRNFISTTTTALNGASDLTQSTLTTYQGYAASALAEANTAIKNLNTAMQNIASQKLTVAGLKADLDLTKAGSTAEDIAAQQAQVENAEAAVASIEAKLGNSEIVAPQAGIVTQFDAKIGEVVAASTPLVSVISDQAFEVDANVPETDIGKVALGDVVSMTLDAFPSEAFTGKVFYIDPAETVTSGVVNYKVKVSFDRNDPRLKSGLTANLDIETNHKDSALILPEYAILTNDQGTFVEVLQNGAVTDVPVTLGLQDSKGNTEVVSGVEENEQVLNIGLKQ